VRDGFDFVDLQNPQVCHPVVRFEHGIVIRTDVSRYTLTVNCRVEHPANVDAGDGAHEAARVNWSMTTSTQ
jgi:hypothetical protein